MFGYNEYSEEGRPWFQAGRVPVTSTVLLVASFTLSMVLVAVLQGAQATTLVSGLPLITPMVWHGEVWRLLTWPFYNVPTIWFALGMLMLFFFGREVERQLGRVGLLKFVGLLAAVLVGVTLLLPRGVLAGSEWLGFGIFLAFALMHPGAPMFFGLQAKWVALILIAISALGSLAMRDVAGLVQLAAVCVASTLILKSMGAATTAIPWLRLPTITFKRRSSRRPGAAASASHRSDSPGPREFVSPEPEIDRLLDKVAAQGLHSLTDAERRLLNDASQRYQRRR